MNNGNKFRRLVAERDVLIVPCAYDCLSARIATLQGFQVIAITGYGVEASALGKPDLGLTTMDTMVRQAKYIVESTDAAVVCDCDTGFGGAINVWQTVKEMQQIGVAAVHIEDQTIPKKCGGMPGRDVVSTDQIVGKIMAAVDARGDGEIVIIARTDARSKYGIKESIDRLNACMKAGADMGLIAEHCEPEELKRAAAEVRGPLAICGGIPGWPESLLPVKTYKDWGIKMVAYPFLALYAAARAIREANQLLKTPELVSQSAVESKMLSFDEFNEIMKISFWNTLAEKYQKV